jgi:mRNA-degrading endonuclease RelE of RelBE toxin-antitoxin system
MRIVLSAGARRQLDELPPRARRTVLDALSLLAAVPRSGTPFMHALPREAYSRLVVVQRRRWSYRVLYELVGNKLIVVYVDPS